MSVDHRGWVDGIHEPYRVDLVVSMAGMVKTFHFRRQDYCFADLKYSVDEYLNCSTDKLNCVIV